jgi:sugar O-acyltransferase (sialic acid O-acetyltransferase NeuD family)
MDTVIIGAGGHGRVVLDLLRAAGTHRVVGFLDADPGLVGSDIHGVPVLGPVNLLMKLRQQQVKSAFVAIGDGRTRVAYANEIRASGLETITAIHPSAIVSSRARVGTNTVICAGAVVCTDAIIGDSVVINTSAVVDHECTVGEGAFIAPGALLAGRVTVGPLAFVGLGAKVIQCRSIGAGAIVGAGAVVVRDVRANAKVMGVPAR